MDKSISYEFYEANKKEGVLNQNDMYIKPPLFKENDKVLFYEDVDNTIISLLVCKAVDYNLYTKDWSYQAISLLTNDYVFVNQSQLKPNKAI
jgi:hypothetical protein|tara:strand:- start:58238 stop:58513 length:276 start_codon:yes stop_codon:yes gene_type:complete